MGFETSCPVCDALAFVHLAEYEGDTSYIVSRYTPEHVALMEAVCEAVAAGKSAIKQTQALHDYREKEGLL